MFAGMVAILTWVAVAAAAEATGPVPVRIDFAAPAGCADGDVFWGGISSRTERARAARPGEPAMRMTVRLTRAGAKVHGELRISNPGGRLEARRVDGATCAEVVQSLSLTAALAIDPLAAATPAAAPAPAAGGKATNAPTDEGRAEPVTPAAPEPPAPPASAGRQEPPAAPPRAAEPASPPAPPAPEPLPPPAPGPETIRTVAPRVETRPGSGPALSAAAVAVRVLSSSVSFGGQVSAGYTSRTSARAPSLTASLSFVAGDFFRSGEDLAVRWYAASIGGCPGWVLGGVATVEPCVRVTGGALTATDHNVANQRTSDRWWGSAGVVLRGEVGRGAGFWLRAELGVDFPIVERRFKLDTTPPQVVGATASISPTLAIGVVHGL
ncbi:MAG: hypothetical protein ABUS79_27225 [Pseudomonadota bacterium]